MSDTGGNSASAPSGRVEQTKLAALPAGHYEALLNEAAGRVVRKEVAAINRAYSRNSASDLEIEIKNFYIDHANFVAETLRIPLDAAARYCGEQLNELTQRGQPAMLDWEIRRVADLVRLTMEAQ